MPPLWLWSKEPIKTLDFAKKIQTKSHQRAAANRVFKTKKYLQGVPLLQENHYLTGFPIAWFLASVHASGDFQACRRISKAPLTGISCNMVFSKSQNAHKAGDLL